MEKRNIGCLIVIVIFVIINIIFTVKGSSSDFASLGQGFILLCGCIASYCAIRCFFHAIDFQGNFKGISCIGSLIIGFLVMLGFSYFADNDNTSYIVGVIVFSIFSIIIGVLLYNNFKDD